MTELTARAKINLYLHVTGYNEATRYHALDSLIAFADFGDRITITPSAQDSMAVTGSFKDQLTETTNSITQALALFKAQANIDDCFSIALDKQLPVAAGIGGGSADAAALLNYLFDHYSLSQETRTAISHTATQELGVELEVCLDGHPSFISGAGEIQERLSLPLELPIVMLNPLKPCPTPDVFKNFRENPEYDQPTDTNPLKSARSIKEFVDALTPLQNTLAPSAQVLVPEISAATKLLSHQNGCLLARLSGSGATCFGIFENNDKAHQAVKHITSQHDGPIWCQAGVVSLS